MTAYNSQFEKKPNSNIHLTITIPAEEIKKEYDQIVGKYCKTVQLKGFRKGKIPPDILIRKFKDSLEVETVQNMLEKTIEQVFNETEIKPLPYAKPKLEEKSEFSLEKDFKFIISYDSYPDIELGKYKDQQIEKIQAEITEDDLNRELKQLQEQNAIVAPKKNEIVEKGDIVTLNYVELDNSENEIEKTKRESFSFTVGSGLNINKIDEDIVGMKNGEERIIDKIYPQDYEYKELAGRNIRLKVKITKIRQKQLPALDDELAADISEKYKTLDDLKKDINSKLHEAAGDKVKENMINQIIENVVKLSKIPLPETMIENNLQMKWLTLLHRFQANEKQFLQELEKQGKSKESLLKEWQPEVEKEIASRLVIEKMIEMEKVEVSDEEMNEEIKKNAELLNSSFEEIKQRYEEENLTATVNYMIKRKKLFDILLKNAVVKKGKKVKYLDIISDKY